MVVEEEDSVVVVGEAVEVLAGDHSKEARVDLQSLATTIAITEDKKRVKMYMMKKSVKKAKPAQSFSMCIPLCFGAAALSTCYLCVPNAAAVLRKRKLHKLNKEPRQEPKQHPHPKQHPKKEPKKELRNKYEIPSMS